MNGVPPVLLKVMVAATMAGTGALGMNQLQQRDAVQEIINKRTPGIISRPVPLAQALAREENPEDLNLTRVKAVGILDYAKTAQVGPVRCPDKSLPPTTGVYLVTPLVTRNNKHLLVNRGWVPSHRLEQGKDYTETKSDAEEVLVEGLLTQGERRWQAYEEVMHRGIWRALNPFLMEQRLKLRPAISTPMVLELDRIKLKGQEARTDILRLQPASHLKLKPTPDEHTLYAITWFALSAGLGAATLLFRVRPKWFTPH